MRILGLDFGSKTVGVAVSDELMLTAQGLEIVRRQSPNKLRQTLARIERIVTEYQVERIVLGYPKNMNNTEGERCEKTKEFAQMLERRTGLSVVLWDERLTTVAADRHMMESGIRRENRKQYVDEIAAVFILQGLSGFHSRFRNIEWSKYGKSKSLWIRTPENRSRFSWLRRQRLAARTTFWRRKRKTATVMRIF